MDVELCRRLARAKQSPFYHYNLKLGYVNLSELIRLGVEAVTFENLPPSEQKFLNLCDRSMEIANQYGLRDFEDNPSLLDQVLSLLAEDRRNDPDYKVSEEDEEG